MFIRAESIQHHTFNITCLNLYILAVFLCPMMIFGQNIEGRIVKTIVKASDQPLVAESAYQLWMPDNSSRIKALFVINMRGAGKHLFFNDHEWKALAQRTQSAMMYCEFEAHSVRDNGYAESITQACNQFALKIKRPELRNVPFVLWGHSMGGRVTQDFVRWNPSRIIAFHIALRAHPSPDEFMKEEQEAMHVPGLYLMGAQDNKPQDIQEHFHKARKNNAPRAWVWLPGQSHWPKGMDFQKNETTEEEWRAWAANDIVIPWTETMIQSRLPVINQKASILLRNISMESGVLAHIPTGEIYPYSLYPGDKSQASWFPNKQIAETWAIFRKNMK